MIQPNEERIELDLKWKELSRNAKINFKDFKEPIIPFRDDVVLCGYNKVYKTIYDKEMFLNDL